MVIYAAAHISEINTELLIKIPELAEKNTADGCSVHEIMVKIPKKKKDDQELKSLMKSVKDSYNAIKNFLK